MNETTPPGTDQALYWIALNLLPCPPEGIRRIHHATGTLDGLIRLRSGEPSRLAGHGSDTRPVAAGPARPDWWARVRAGEIGYGSPRFGEEDSPSGEDLVRAAEDELSLATRAGIGILTLAGQRYPPLLATIASPPPVLYYLGDLSALDSSRPGDSLPSRPRDAIAGWWEPDSPAAPTDPLSAAHCALPVAVVGSRTPTDYGSLVARRLARYLAGAGAVVISGLARGIDTEAHLGALDAAGVTVAVLGGGLAPLEAGGAGSLPACPASKIPLVRRIAGSGLVLSEYPLGSAPLRAHFPRRNRIIVGLSAAVAVIEAARTSGALITARLALEEGRDIFAVPGRITNPTAAGTNGLIRSGAAAMLCSEESLIEDLPSFWRERLPPAPGTETGADDQSGGPRLPFGSSVDAGLGRAERSLVGCLRADEPTSTDELVGRSGLAPGEVLSLLAGLEIRGLVRSLPGSRYILQP